MTTLYNDDLLFPGESATSGILKAPSSGIGIAPDDPLKAEYGRMSPSSRTFARLAEFGSGVTGQPSPMQARVEMRRREKLTQLEELKSSISALEHGVKLAEELDEGEKKTGFIDAYSEQLERVQLGLGATFKTLADRPSLLANFQQYLPLLPPPMQELARKDKRAFLRFVGTAEGAKLVNQAADHRVLQTAGKKRDTVVMGWQQLVPQEKIDKLMEDGVLTDAEIMEIQGGLPEQLRFTDDERGAISRNPSLFWEGSGVLYGSKASEVAAERAKRTTREPTPTELTKLIRERDSLPPRDPMRKVYDERIAKLTAQRPVAGAKPAVPKPESPKDKEKREQTELTLDSAQERIESLISQLQKNSALVGPAGIARRAIETGVGVVSPDVATPALDYQNNLRLLLADVRKLIEKDPNLSNEERRNLYETIGGGTFQTSGSALRALNEVRDYVAKKRPKGKEYSEEDLKFTAEKHGITVEEVKRRLGIK